MLGEVDELHFPLLKVSYTVKLLSIMKWLWLEFSSAVLLGTGKLLLNNAHFVSDYHRSGVRMHACNWDQPVTKSVS